MKKLLLSLGAIASVAAPVAAVVACGSDKTATPAKTTPSKTHEAAPKVQPEDEGFTEGSLIENFDINAESQKETPVYELFYAGKKYDDYATMIKAWAVDFRDLVENGHEVMGTVSTDYKDAGITGVHVSIKGDAVTIAYLDDKGAEDPSFSWVINSPADLSKTIKKVYSLNYHIPFNQSLLIWEPQHPLEARPTTKLGELKHSIDSIIYSQAQSLTNTIDADHDKVIIDSSSKELGFAEMTTNGFDDFQYNAEKTSFSSGDTLTFVFDNERDVKAFTQRVGYIDGVNNMFTSATAPNKVMRLGVLDGTIYSYEPKADAPDKSKAAFKIEAIAKNAVKLTFLNASTNPGNDQGTKQFFVLNGFEDLNGDGIITKSDRGITNPFDYK